MNYNYKAKMREESLNLLKFRQKMPIQARHSTDLFKLVAFKNGQCRLMGVKKPLTQQMIDSYGLNIQLGPLQSCTVTIDFRRGSINLIQLRNRLGCANALFEAELFPALRLLIFNPLSVNIFASGKCVIMGYKSVEFDMNLAYRIEEIVWSDKI